MGLVESLDKVTTNEVFNVGEFKFTVDKSAQAFVNAFTNVVICFEYGKHSETEEFLIIGVEMFFIYMAKIDHWKKKREQEANTAYP